MPGKLCTGSEDVGYVEESKAFCEGRASKAAGGAIGDNPHPAESDSGKAWLAGLASTEKGCCAA